MNRIRSLESLRGLLALWVIVGHTIKHSGYSEKDFGLFKALANPGLAVDVFIILSGFVIFFLLDRQHTTYAQYLLKRWFRLSPMYFFVILISAISITWQTRLIANFPFKNITTANDLSLHLSAVNYFSQQLLTHLTLMHGAISSSILPDSEYAFVGQAWSISVEWQFYLLAPFVFFLIKIRRWRNLCCFTLALCLLRSLNYGGEGFLVNQAIYFMVGIGSYYLWKHADSIKIESGLLDFITVLVAAMVYLALNRTLSLLMWVFVLSALIAERRHMRNSLQQTVIKILDWQLFQWLGKLSYSLYLIHMLVFYFIELVVLHLFPQISQAMFLSTMLPAVVGVTVGLSALTYRFIEKPGINAGIKVSIHLAGPNASNPVLLK